MPRYQHHATRVTVAHIDAAGGDTRYPDAAGGDTRRIDAAGGDTTHLDATAVTCTARPLDNIPARPDIDPAPPAPAFPLPAPRDWFQVLAELNRLGRNNAEVARLLGLNPNSVRNWKYGSEPRHSTGEALLALLRRRRRAHAAEQQALRKRALRMQEEAAATQDGAEHANAPQTPAH